MKEDKLQDGKRRLRALLPRAKAHLRQHPGGMRSEPLSPLGERQFDYLREDKIRAVTVYPAPKGGWHADVVFKGLPEGVPNTMGTRVEEPVATREEAEERAFDTLVMVLHICAQNAKRPKPPKSAIFWIYDAVMELSQDCYNALRAFDPASMEGYGTKERAIERIEQVIKEITPDGFSHAAYTALPKEEQVKLFAVAHIAALTGVFRYPPRLDGAPKEEAPTPDKKIRWLFDNKAQRPSPPFGGGGGGGGGGGEAIFWNPKRAG